MNPLLQVRGLESFYGQSQALFGMELDVGPAEVVTLIGRNGMGKSTTVKSVMGMLAPRRGSVQVDGVDLTGAPAHVVARHGIGLVPEGRRVFASLTVRENLIATAANLHRRVPPWTLDRVYATFPRLKERADHLACNLSGGEQQMLAIGRALMTNPKLLVLDEATEGLAPLVRAEIWRCLAQLKDEGLSLIVIDKNVAALLDLADRHHVVAKGRVVWQGSTAALRAQPQVLHEHLGV